jgi:hypothetical protein
MWQGRPVYRFARGAEWRVVYADTGAPLGEVAADAAVAAVRAFVPEHAGTIRYEARLDDSDQWTLSSVIRAQMPLHRVALGDADGTSLYLSARTGDVVMKTDAPGRFWGYAGAVLHWVYFTPLRRRVDLWDAFIVYGSLVGCVMCVSGLVAGLWRWSRAPRYRLRGASGPSRSPYAGMMKWHHYGGLIFGVITFTWILSGMLSMNPWDWSPGSSPTRAQRAALAGGPLDLDRLEAGALRQAAQVLTGALAAREVEVVQFDGAPYLAAYRPPPAAEAGQWTNTDLAAFLSPQTTIERGITRVGDPAGRMFDRFERATVERLTRGAVAGAEVVEAVWLDAAREVQRSGRHLVVCRSAVGAARGQTGASKPPRTLALSGPALPRFSRALFLAPGLGHRGRRAQPRRHRRERHGRGARLASRAAMERRKPPRPRVKRVTGRRRRRGNMPACSPRISRWASSTSCRAGSTTCCSSPRSCSPHPRGRHCSGR